MDGTLCDFSGEVEGEKGAGPEIHSNKNCECERVCVCVCGTVAYFIQDSTLQFHE